ncbi:hypothetical protein [Streptomyces sp. NPDC127112]|uniref:hypothetical protein n=1 Tax=Streptomyces sp. NPDC127112 TaxID=3345364 RepID=UPI00362ACF6F
MTDDLLFDVPEPPTPVERLLALAGDVTRDNDALNLLRPTATSAPALGAHADSATQLAHTALTAVQAVHDQQLYANADLIDATVRIKQVTFHGNAQWRSIRDSSPSEWADVVEFDGAIRHGNARANATGNPLLGQAYLHRSRVPLSEAPIDHVTAAEWAALQQDTGAPDAEDLEAGAVDGCSPWACKGEQPEPVRDDFGLAV